MQHVIWSEVQSKNGPKMEIQEILWLFARVTFFSWHALHPRAKPHGKRRLDSRKQKQQDKYSITCIDTFFLGKTSFKYNGLSKRPFVTPETSTCEDEDLNERKMFGWSVSNDHVGLFTNRIMLNGNVLCVCVKRFIKIVYIHQSLSGAHKTCNFLLKWDEGTIYLVNGDDTDDERRGWRMFIFYKWQDLMVMVNWS